MVGIALLLGGPSEERGISLNSARSIADHLESSGVHLKEIVYFDHRSQAYSISRGLLYCNTPSDFDFKLSHTDAALDEEALLARLGAVDLAFPAMHGAFGEDGQVQAILERAGVPYVGADAAACRTAFDKFRAKEALAAAGIDVVPSVLVTSADSAEQIKATLKGAFPAAKKLVLKPAQGGSSIDVFVARTRTDAGKILRRLLKKYDRVVVQPRMTGVEVTTIVLDGPAGPAALLPIQIELNNLRSDDDFFDYRRKYLASNDSHYHCPPPQPPETVASIQRSAETVFRTLGLRDFARIDGWLQPDGRVMVSDVNPISGMEQNSFLFIQAAQLGMNHGDVLRYIVRNAARRAGIDLAADVPKKARRKKRKQIPVLFGGSTAERQVSVLSGTNVWLKLLASERYEPVPYLLDRDGWVWRLSYASALRHSVEEIVEACEEARLSDGRRHALADEIIDRLQLTAADLHAPVFPPSRLSMDEFLDAHDAVFLGLHGGMGEDGTIQALLDKRGIRYNGSGSVASRLCMDKYETGLVLAGLSEEGIYTAKRTKLAVPKAPTAEQVAKLWRKIQSECGSQKVVVKPLDDGCSAGVLPLGSAEDLAEYLGLLNAGATRLSGARFSLLVAEQLIELPTQRPNYLIFEEFIETDDIRAEGTATGAGQLVWGEERDTGWVEVTVGVMGPAGQMVAMNPSITVASRGILSLEEKFMGGTGVNLTPPPTSPLGRIEPAAIERAKVRIARAANALGIAGYARLDAFMHRDTGEVIIIEANSLPGLTPATVFYHQGLAEDPPIYPRQVLERIVDLALLEPSA